MANEENLKPIRNENEAREKGKKGGIASGKSRKRKKLLRDTVEMLVSLPLHNGKLDKIECIDDVENNNITIEEAMILKQIDNASKGDLNALKFILSLYAEQEKKQTDKPTEGTQQTDNSFIMALNGKSNEVWDDEETNQ